MKTVSREQALQVVSTLATNADWNQVDSDFLQANAVTKATEAGKEFTKFLQNGCRMIVAVVATAILKLAECFNPGKFMGENWSIWKGPVDGKGLEGEEDRDVREDGLTEIDWTKMELDTCLKEGEPSIPGEEKLRRIKASGKIRLGGKTFLALLQDHQKNGEASVLEQLRKVRGVTYLSFSGLILRSPIGSRCILCLCSSGGLWVWVCRCLDCGWDSEASSASLASVPENQVL